MSKCFFVSYKFENKLSCDMRRIHGQKLEIKCFKFHKLRKSQIHKFFFEMQKQMINNLKMIKLNRYMNNCLHDTDGKGNN